MILEKNEGIVLRATLYREKDRILTLFTKNQGCISLIMKGVSNKNYHLLALSSPLSQGEYLYTKGNSSLYSFQDGTLLDEHLLLRKKWSYLEAAGEMGRLLLKSQMHGEPAPLLYLLFTTYLKQIPSFENPSHLIASFILKLLHHEGVLGETEFSSLLQVRSFEALRAFPLSASQLHTIRELATTSLLQTF